MVLNEITKYLNIFTKAVCYVKKLFRRFLFFDLGEGIDFLMSIMPWTRSDYCQEKLHPSLRAMLGDRPEMAAVLKNHNSLIRWLNSQFAGKATKFLITWDPREPQHLAEHMPPVKDRPALIRVSNQQSGVDQLVGAIFELFNIRFFKNRRQLWRAACKGDICREEYKKRNAQLENQAMIQTRRFIEGRSFTFRDASEDDVSYQSDLCWSSSYKEVLRRFKQIDRKTPYEMEYDEKIMPHLESNLHRCNGSPNQDRLKQQK